MRGNKYRFFILENCKTAIYGNVFSGLIIFAAAYLDLARIFNIDISLRLCFCGAQASFLRGLLMPAKISLAKGSLSIDFEGEETFFVEHIRPLFLTVLESGRADGVSSEDGERGQSTPRRQAMTMTTKSIASKFGVDSGTTLAYAAAAALSLMQDREQFSRQNLHDEMKTATGFYKQTFGSNLSNYIDTLTKQGTLIEVAKDVFTVKSSELDAMRSKLDA